ncbi:MAG: DUF5915 domain-containing protein [Solirubrobacterales bacterium]|nr:DUF5915 domain-containing protein [Solirubrobacterales bacterium]
MPKAAAAVAGLDPAHVGQSLKDGSAIHINVGGTEHLLAAEDLLITMQPLDGYQLEREGSHAVALDLNLDDDLLLEGLAREIVHAVQAARRDSGLDISDRISLSLGGDERLMEAADRHGDYIASEVLAEELTLRADSGESEVTIDGLTLSVSLVRS